MKRAAWCLAVAALTAVGGAGVEGASCKRLELEEPTPAWTFHGAWDADGRLLSLTDTTGARILQYRQDGSLSRTIVAPGRGRLEFDHPISLLFLDGRYLLKDGTDRWLWFDADFEPVSSFGPHEMAPTFPLGDGRPLSVEVAELSAVKGKGIGYSIGVFRDGQRFFGWLSLDLETGRIETFREEAPEFDHWRMDRLTAPSQATVGDTVYQLRWGKPTRLRRVFPETAADLSAFPSDFRSQPGLPPPGGPGNSAANFRALALSTVATGLYGKGDRLYVLTRRPEEDGTRWDLHTIDPVTDRLLGAVRLPTTAPHAFLVPGPVYWAVVEKGPVVVGGQQPVVGVVLVPSTWIEAEPGSGTEGRDETIGCS